MRILIIGTPRSGTTTLMNAISYGLKLVISNEPFHPNAVNKVFHESQTNIVLKTLIHHVTFDKLDELRGLYDKTILLSRKDVNAAWESECNAIHRREETLNRKGMYDGFYFWHEPYVHNSESLNEKHKPGVIERMNLLKDYSIHSGEPILWYEDLYSNDKTVAKSTFNSIGLGVDYDSVYSYMNPSKKYRRDGNTLI